MERESNSKQKAAPVKYMIILAVITAGVLLQITTGPFPYEVIRFPVNLILSIVLIILAAVRPGRVLETAGSLPISVFLIILITIQSIVMGLMPDNSLKDSWPFVLTYFMLLINLVLIVGRRVRTFRLKKDVGFILNHAGLFILLVSSGFGAADSRHLFMRINEGETLSYAEHYGTGIIVELPFKLTLEDFVMEFYAPKFFLIDAQNGEMKQISDNSPQGWKVTVDSLIDRAGFVPEALISVKGPDVDTVGMVGGGNNMQPPKFLRIDKFRYISMGDLQTKSYCSHVILSRDNDPDRKEEIRVNHPMISGSWWIYQFSYDQKMGCHSKYSVLELVHDPWIIPVYMGILMLFAGAVSLFWKGGRS